MSYNERMIFKRICLSLLLAASMIGSACGRVAEKVRELKLAKLIVATTIFELTPDGKVPVSSFQSELEKEWPKKLSTHEGKKLGMKIVYIWTKTNSWHYSFGEGSVREMDSFTINVHRENPAYFADHIIGQTVPLNFSGFQHIVTDVRVFNENFEKLFEVHTKVKQVFR